jgi:hypothetical protein
MDGSAAAAAGSSGRVQDGESASSASSTNPDGSSANSDGTPSVRGGIYQLGIWLSGLFVLLLVIPMAVWGVVKVLRRKEAAQDDEVVYQNLDAVKIYGKIIKKY